jgi:hydroxyacylglutathione hydrolase
MGAAIALLLSGFWSPAIAQKPPKVPINQTFDRTEAGPLTRPHIASIASNTYFINEFGVSSEYVLIGADRALLIDTGTGFYDIKGTVKKLTSLPLEVAHTHIGKDHGGMIGNFETAYVHPDDAKTLKDINELTQKEHGEKMWNESQGYSRIWGYTPADLKWNAFDKHPTIKPLSDGQVFDLGGGRLITVYHMPGHTAGSCAFLDRKTRILFTGDIVTGLTKIPVSTMLRSYLKVQKLRPEYDRIFTGHTAPHGVLDVLPLEPETLDDLIDVSRQVLRGEARLEKCGKSTCANYKKVSLQVNPDRLWEPGEPHFIP